jgi:hypothetical protein
MSMVTHINEENIKAKLNFKKEENNLNPTIINQKEKG